MKKLIAIAALTILTSTAWASDEVGDSWSGNSVVSEKAHDIQLGNNDFYASMLIAQPADRPDTAGLVAQQGVNELYGIL